MTLLRIRSYSVDPVLLLPDANLIHTPILYFNCIPQKDAIQLLSAQESISTSNIDLSSLFILVS